MTRPIVYRCVNNVRNMCEIIGYHGFLIVQCPCILMCSINNELCLRTELFHCHIQCKAYYRHDIPLNFKVKSIVCKYPVKLCFTWIDRHQDLCILNQYFFVFYLIFDDEFYNEIPDMNWLWSKIHLDDKK